MKLCAAAVLLLTMAWATPVAGAAEVTRTDRAGDVRGGARLGERQRAALDIVRVRARADTAGLAVDVRLRGDFERLAGSGALKGAMAAIELRRGRAGRGTLLTRGPDRRAQVRSERAGPGPVVVRDGRLLHFRVAGDVSTVTSVRVRVAAARRHRTTPFDEAGVTLARDAPGVAPCQALVRARTDLAEWLSDVGRELARARARNRRKRLTQERTALEEHLFGLGRQIGLGCPGVAPLAGDPGDPGDSTANQAPFASFVVSPPGPGFKAGQTLSFRATGSRDPDGTIAQYLWSDGDPPHPIETGVQMIRWYGAPGIYTIRLTVTDDRGGTTFTSKRLFVGGVGSKALRNPDNSMVRIDCPGPGASPGGGAVEITVPSYAADPAVSTPNPCPDASLDTTMTRITGNAHGETDEWARARDTIRITYALEHLGPGPGSQNVALDWSAGWQ